MKPLAITLGDPAGIGAEVVAAALTTIDYSDPVWLFGEWKYFVETPGADKLVASLTRVTDPRGVTNWTRNVFVDVALSGSESLHFGTVDAAYGRIALASISKAVECIEDGLCAGLITAPINKQAIRAAGGEFPGHTELLASKAGFKRYGFEYAMYFDSPSLRVALLSVHLPLRQALSEIDASKIAGLASLVTREYRRLYGTSPRLGVAGVNPHAGEEGLFGNEDAIVAEGVRQAVAAGNLASGPHAADTIFHAAAGGRYDVVLAMYHDQGLIAVKTLAFDLAVNVTLGLPYLRCSVDHGTAFDIAGKGIADPAPMRNAIEWARRYADRS